MDTEAAVYRSSSLAAPSQEGNWLRGLNSNPTEAVATFANEASGYSPSLDYKFCVPENPVFASLQFKSELNLFKIRTCRNIAGMKRQIDPFAAPTDTSSGMPVIGPGGNLVLPGNNKLLPTPYRYEVLIARAKEMVSTAQQIESVFMATLEKLDAERYSVMKAKQDMKLSKATVKLQNLRVKEAESSVDLARKQVDRAKFQADHFNTLISEGLNSYEEESFGSFIGSLGFTKARLILFNKTAVASYTALSVLALTDVSINGANIYAESDTAKTYRGGN